MFLCTDCSGGPQGVVRGKMAMAQHNLQQLLLGDISRTYMYVSYVPEADAINKWQTTMHPTCI